MCHLPCSVAAQSQKIVPSQSWLVILAVYPSSLLVIFQLLVNYMVNSFQPEPIWYVLLCFSLTMWLNTNYFWSSDPIWSGVEKCPFWLVKSQCLMATCPLAIARCLSSPILMVPSPKSNIHVQSPIYSRRWRAVDFWSLRNMEDAMQRRNQWRSVEHISISTRTY